jgi:lipopolysaccharide biosynthesis regulator YciM
MAPSQQTDDEVTAEDYSGRWNAHVSQLSGLADHLSHNDTAELRDHVDALKELVDTATANREALQCNTCGFDSEAGR